MKRKPISYYLEKVSPPQDCHRFTWRPNDATFKKIDSLSKATRLPINSLLTAAVEKFVDETVVTKKFKLKE